MKSFTEDLLIVVRVRKLEQYPGGSFSEAEASPEVQLVANVGSFV